MILQRLGLTWEGWITVIQSCTEHRLRPSRSSSESKIRWLALCYNSRECHMLVHCLDHSTGCRSPKESSLMSQLWRIRYALYFSSSVSALVAVEPHQWIHGDIAVGISAASTRTTCISLLNFKLFVLEDGKYRSWFVQSCFSEWITWICIMFASSHWYA